MKKLGLALIAAVTMSAPAFAADMRMPVKAAPAPIAVPAFSFTGCYIKGGIGGGFQTREWYPGSDPNFVAYPGYPTQTDGAKGWFGTVGGGCDYQIGQFVLGVFGDYDFTDIKGQVAPYYYSFYSGERKQDWQWSVGGRVGYVPAMLPQLLAYVSGGYTQAHWKQTNLDYYLQPSTNYALPAHTRAGWFLGTGYNYALGFLPGLFWQTEYRYNWFETKNTPILEQTTLLPTGDALHEKINSHTIRSELVYKFNWSGR